MDTTRTELYDSWPMRSTAEEQKLAQQSDSTNIGSRHSVAQQSDSTNIGSRHSVAEQVLRWSGRVLSLASVGIILMFLNGEGRNLANITARELQLFVCFPVGVSAGNILGWWSEKWGGALGLAGLVGFYAVNYLQAGAFPSGWAIPVLALPSLLYVLSHLQWWRAKAE